MYLKLKWFVSASRDGGFLALELFSRLFTHASARYGLHARLRESMLSIHHGKHDIPTLLVMRHFGSRGGTDVSCTSSSVESSASCRRFLRQLLRLRASLSGVSAT